MNHTNNRPGGQACFEKYGPNHMREMGRNGGRPRRADHLSPTQPVEALNNIKNKSKGVMPATANLKVLLAEWKIKQASILGESPDK